MKNRFKKISLIIILIVVISYMSVVAFGAEGDNTSLAEYLNKIGLIQGTGYGYGLDSITTRAQGAVIIVRLMGKEKEAIEMSYSHPFDDVPYWADDYIGYLWENDISKGIDDDLYGSDLLLSPSDYMTFLIRVLGYREDEGDFKWNTSLEKAVEIGIINSTEFSQYKQKKNCYRNDMVLFSYRALDADLKNGNGVSLLRMLMDDGDVPQTAMLDYHYAPYKATSTNYQATTDAKVQQLLVQSMLSFESKIVIDIKESKLSSFDHNWEQAIDTLNMLPGYYATVSGCSYSISNQKISVSFKYNTTKSRYEQAIKKAKEVGLAIINSEMTDYQREFVIHDYIVDHTRYVDKGNVSRNLEGIFLNKEAVCGGYAQAFYYLATYAGLDSEFVLGDGIQDGAKIAHAWNTVEIDGDWYQIDVTWDDPVTTNGENKKTYAYFNLTNEEMKIDHIWDVNAYAIALGTQYNYYNLNNQTVYGIEGLKGALKQGFSNKEQSMTFKVLGESISSNQLKSILDGYSGFKSLNYAVASRGLVEISNITYY